MGVGGWGGGEKEEPQVECELLGLLGCCVFVVEYYKNPASDPLFPDLQMDRVA